MYGPRNQMGSRSPTGRGIFGWGLCTVKYRVAQNKIPHQTICNIFATSGQILKILEAV